MDLQKVIYYATDCHQAVNQRYDDLDYSFHLNSVAAYAARYSYLVDASKLQTVLAAAWCHDLIEDTRQTYNDVLKNTNLEVAEIVYALTNEKGKNRKERANEKYYQEMKQVPNAVFVKICDRLANIKHSKNTNSRMLDLYRKEITYFSEQLWSSQYDEMFNEITELLQP